MTDSYRTPRASGTETDERRVLPDGGRLDEDEVEEALADGETVRTDIYEHAAIESEVVDSELVGREVVEEEIVSQELTGVAVAERVEERSEADDDRYYLDRDDDVDPQYVEEEAAVVVEFDEVRTEIVEEIERKTIESRVVEDDGAEVEITIEGVEERIVDSDLVAVDADGDEGMLEQVDVNSEFVEEGTVHSQLTERRTIEREVADEKELVATVTDIDVGNATTTHEQLVAREIVSDDDFEIDVTEEVEIEGEDESAATTTTTTVEDESGTATTGERDEPRTAAVEITENDLGKEVMLPSGEDIGIVSEVEPDEETLYVDPEPSMTDRLKASLHWGDEDDAYPLDERQIESVDRDTVVVEPRDEVDR